MGTVVGSWRLKTIIVLFLTIFSIYTCYSFFKDLSINDYYEYGVNETDDYAITENDTTKGLEESDDFWDIVLGLGDFLSFGSITNVWARLVINIFTSVCWIMIGYIGYTFIKEWIPFT